MCMTTDKFNCTVPGTLPTNTSQCSLRINEMTTASLSNTHQHTSLPLTPSMAAVITVGAIVILSCVIGASLVLCVRHGRECTSKYIINLIFILKCRIFLIINNHNNNYY